MNCSHPSVPLESSLPRKEFVAAYRRALLELQKGILESGHNIADDLPVVHDFAPGVYVRSLYMPKGIFVIGATHKTDHLNIALTGAANVMIDGDIEYVQAPFIKRTAPGIKKAFFVLEDMVWSTIHPTDETDLEKLEDDLIYNHEQEMKFLEAEVQKCLGQQQPPQ